MTGKLVWHATMSLDGFIAGPDDTIDWAMGSDAEPSTLGTEVSRSTGAVLAGRRWHDLAISRWNGRAGIYDENWNGLVFVLTHNPPESPPDPEIRFLSDGIRSAVETALAAADGMNVVVFGASLNQQCLAEGLLDEIVIHLVPVLLGDGVRFHTRAGTDLTRLETVSVAQVGQRTDLRFRVVREGSAS